MDKLNLARAARPMQRTTRGVFRSGIDTYDPNHELTDAEIDSMTKPQMDHYISTEPVLPDDDPSDPNYGKGMMDD